MPIPKPKKDETHDDFMSRCMGNPTMNEDFPDSAQRAAVCQTSWEDSKKSSTLVQSKHLAPVQGIKALSSDDQPGMFEGYASVFNNVDIFGEKVLPGAFVDSLVDKKRRGMSIKMFWNHNPSEPIGRWLDMAEDSKGLFVKGQINLQVQRAKEIHLLMLDGAVDSMSIGFFTEEADFEDGVLLLKRLNLLEVSPVSLPANDRARIDDVKSAERVARFDQFCAALKAGTPLPVKDFEDLLREAGVPKSMAKQIASVGYARAIRCEADGHDEALTELRASLASLR